MIDLRMCSLSFFYHFFFIIAVREKVPLFKKNPTFSTIKTITQINVFVCLKMLLAIRQTLLAG